MRSQTARTCCSVAWDCMTTSMGLKFNWLVEEDKFLEVEIPETPRPAVETRGRFAPGKWWRASVYIKMQFVLFRKGRPAFRAYRCSNSGRPTFFSTYASLAFFF